MVLVPTRFVIFFYIYYGNRYQHNQSFISWPIAGYVLFNLL